MVPAFDNRVPMDILKEDGEIELYKWMSTIPCGAVCEAVEWKKDSY